MRIRTIESQCDQGVKKFYIFTYIPLEAITLQLSQLTLQSVLCYNHYMDTIIQQQQRQLESIKALAEHIPMNDFGLPTGVYRSDLLPFSTWVDPTIPIPLLPHTLPDLNLNPEPQTTCPEESHDVDISPSTSLVVDDKPQRITPQRRVAGFLEDELRQAFIPLFYEEGFPAFANGQAFWEKFEFEPVESFVKFERYLQLGVGRAANPDNPEDTGLAATGFRSVSELAQIIAHEDDTLLATLDELNMLSTFHYWGLRARAYDIFKVARHRKQQELRAIEMQDEHFVRSRKMMARLDTYMEDEEEFWDLMTPKVAIDFLDKLVKMQRLSVDMPINGPTNAYGGRGEDDPTSLSLAVHLKQAASGTGRSDDEGNVFDNNTGLLEKALEDPALTEDLQEIIIRLNVGEK